MITATQIRMARAGLNITISDLSKKTGLHRNTLVSTEKEGSPTRESTANNLQSAFESMGAKFIEDNGVLIEKLTEQCCEAAD